MVRAGKRLDPDDLTARGLEQSINGLWADENATEQADIAALFRQLVRPIRSPVIPAEDVIGDCWLGRFLDYAREGKAPPHLFLGAALGFLAGGLCAKGEGLIEWSVLPLHLNLYVLLVCGTGSGKSVALHHAEKIIAPALGPNVLPNEGSHQGFADHLRRRWLTTGVCADGLIVADEFRTLISKDKYKSEAATWLTEWYQRQGRWARALRGEKGEYEFYNPRLSIVAASTKTWLHELPPDTLVGGFLYRFLWFVADEGRWGKAEPGFDDATAATLTAELAKVVVPASVGFTKASKDWLVEWHAVDHRREWELNESERFRGWLERKQAHIMKLAGLQHIVERHRGEICVKCLEWARGLVNWLDQGVMSVQSDLGTSEESTIYKDLRDAVARLQQRGKVASRKRLIRSGLRNKYRVEKIDKALAYLVRDGDLKLSGATALDGSAYEVVDDAR